MLLPVGIKILKNTLTGYSQQLQLLNCGTPINTPKQKPQLLHIMGNKIIENIHTAAFLSSYSVLSKRKCCVNNYLIFSLT